jgi:CBS domain-containing protein
LIPVLENGKLVGVVGRLDIVRSMGSGSGSRAKG